MTDILYFYVCFQRLSGLLSSQTVRTKTGSLLAAAAMQPRCLETKGSSGCFLFSQGERYNYQLINNSDAHKKAALLYVDTD